MSKNVLLDAHDQMHEMVREGKRIMNVIISNMDFKSPLTGEAITNWDQMMKEMEAIENEIKKSIKEGYTGLDETDYFVIRKTTTYEYDPEKLREIYPDAGFFIVTKESVSKAQLDKAVKDGMVPESVKEALKEKSTSISFIDKQKIADKEVKEIAV